jgi:EAL domain-containing protein (putative c-di-GMP-specific phosphodiesterase class I)
MTSTAAIPPARNAGVNSGVNAGINAGATASDGTESVRRAQLAALRRVLAEGGPAMVYQPQLSLSRLVVDGYEALARFPDSPMRGAEQWFGRARELGMGPSLEAAALQRALEHRQERPAGTTLAVNLSPGVLSSPAVAAVLPDDLSGIEIEVTEHEWVAGGGRLRKRLDRLRERGAGVAIDDVGVAHSGLRRVMDLAPDRIKLDRHLVQGVATSTAKTALIRAVVDFADRIGSAVCAEGVENVDDLEALAELDVGHAQGWMIGLPESDFRGADPLAVAAGRESLASMLAGPQRDVARRIDLTAPATADVEDLLVRLTRVDGLSALGGLTDLCAGVLGGDLALISMLTPDGSMVRSVGFWPGGPGQEFHLADFPVTRRCLETRAVIPIYLGSDGDPAEWSVLSQLGHSCALLVPVISRDRVIGLLECYRRQPTAWSRRQIRSARTVAAMIGPVLDNLIQR